MNKRKAALTELAELDAPLIGETLPTEAQMTASLLEAKDVTIAELRRELQRQALWADFRG